MNIPLVLINGWAMPDTVFEPLIAKLAGIEMTIINLSDIPAKADDFTLDSMVQSLRPMLPDMPLVLAGWSYGGTLACAYASTFPDKVTALITLSSNPCFVAKPDWQHAMSPVTFDEFLTTFHSYPEKTLEQFSLLCSMGSNNKKQLSRQLRKLLTTSDSMERTLNVLGLADTRRQMTNISCPVMHCYGKQDALVPSTVAEGIQASFSNHKTEIHTGGHCFFLDHPDPVATLLKHHCQGGC